MTSEAVRLSKQIAQGITLGTCRDYFTDATNYSFICMYFILSKQGVLHNDDDRIVGERGGSAFVALESNPKVLGFCVAIPIIYIAHISVKFI